MYTAEIFCDSSAHCSAMQVRAETMAHGARIDVISRRVYIINCIWIALSLGGAIFIRMHDAGAPWMCRRCNGHSTDRHSFPCVLLSVRAVVEQSIVGRFVHGATENARPENAGLENDGPC